MGRRCWLVHLALAAAHLFEVLPRHAIAHFECRAHERGLWVRRPFLISFPCVRYRLERTLHGLRCLGADELGVDQAVDRGGPAQVGYHVVVPVLGWDEASQRRVVVLVYIEVLVLGGLNVGAAVEARGIFLVLYLGRTRGLGRGRAETGRVLVQVLCAGCHLDEGRRDGGLLQMDHACLPVALPVEHLVAPAPV